MSRIKKILSILLMYITVVGIVTFSLFIHEEAVQMVMFGTWPAKNAKQWDIVKEGIDIMGSINTSSRWINRIAGWIQPLAFLSYRQFNRATDFYIKALESEAFANAPHLFVGETMEVSLFVKTFQKDETGKFVVQSGALPIIFEHQPVLGTSVAIIKIIKDEATGRIYGIVD